MRNFQSNDDARADLRAPAAATTADEGESMAGLPLLPAGYLAQPLCGFTDKTGLLTYEFQRVYGPDKRGIGRSLTKLDALDQERSYWLMTSARLHASGDESPISHSISYKQARRLQAHPLTFEQFSNLREELPALLHAQDLLSASVHASAR